jgi:hypothetical protein
MFEASNTPILVKQLSRKGVSVLVPKLEVDALLAGGRVGRCRTLCSFPWRYTPPDQGAPPHGIGPLYFGIG